MVGRAAGSFECYVSQVVLDEVSGGDPEEAKTRLAIIRFSRA